ncbi:hypothetical protein GCM10027053_51450 [Intrasporangium mesophilum]
MTKSRARVRRRAPGTRRGNRVIIYIRVSDTTGREDTLISDEVQEQVCRRFAQRDNLVIVDVIVELDKSGRESSKRAIAAIIDRVEAKEADGVLVWKISRWGRNTIDSMLNIGELQEAGGFILSATENLDDIDTPAGKFSLTVLLAIAQMYSDEIGKVWSNVHDYRISNGKPGTGGLRFGYIRDKDADCYEVDPFTGPWLRKAYERYVSGEAITGIVRSMNEAGVETTRGTRMTVPSLRATMDGGFGAGLVVDRRGEEDVWAPGTHEALISEETWQAYLRRRALKVPARTKSAPYRVAGLVRCGSCGGTMSVYWRVYKGEKVRSFRCNRIDNGKNSRLCPAPVTAKEERVEAALLAWLEEHVAGDAALQTHHQRALAATQAQVDGAKIDRDIERVQKRLSLLLDKYMDGLSKEAYTLKERELTEQLAHLREAKEQATVRVEVNSLPDGSVFGALLTGWDILDPAIFNTGLRNVVREIVLSKRDGGLGGRDTKIRVVGQWEAVA